MNRPKKNSTVAQASTEQSAEAVRQLRPLTSKTSLKDPSIKDKDGDDGNVGLTQIMIEVALDGYMVTFSFEDGSEQRYVREDFDEVLSLVRGMH